MIWSPQEVRGKDCVCDLKNTDPAFPENKLKRVETTAFQCTEIITSEKVLELHSSCRIDHLDYKKKYFSKYLFGFGFCCSIYKQTKQHLLNRMNVFVKCPQMLESDRLLLGLHQRISQLEDNVKTLEKEDDRNVYGAVSLRIIELELAEIRDLLNKLNKTTRHFQQLSVEAKTQVASGLILLLFYFAYTNSTHKQTKKHLCDSSESLSTWRTQWWSWRSSTTCRW